MTRMAKSAWETGEFELDWDAYLRIKNPDMDVERVGKQVFDQRVEEIRKGLARDR